MLASTFVVPLLTRRRLGGRTRHARRRRLHLITGERKRTNPPTAEGLRVHECARPDPFLGLVATPSVCHGHSMRSRIEDRSSMP
jgi:hypothetical protein